MSNKKNCNTTDYRINRQHKSTLFTSLFGEDAENALSLYNAVNHTDYTNTEDLTYTTLGDVVYMKMKNDVSFIIGKTMNLYEHQSTYNPNMPLRGFLYFADLYRKYIQNNARIYSSSLLKIPAPHYLVFYNGDDKDFPEDVRELHLSDAFDEPVEAGKYEWTATMININHGKNTSLKQSCQILASYSDFTSKVKKYSKRMDIKAAIDKAVDESILAGGKLGDFLSKHKREIKNMILTEFDEEKYLEMVKEESFIEGREEGRIEAHQNTLVRILTSRFHSVPEELASTLTLADEQSLSKWVLLAATVSDLDEFLENI